MYASDRKMKNMFANQKFLFFSFLFFSFLFLGQWFHSDHHEQKDWLNRKKTKKKNKNHKSRDLPWKSINTDTVKKTKGTNQFFIFLKKKRESLFVRDKPSFID